MQFYVVISFLVIIVIKNFTKKIVDVRCDPPKKNCFYYFMCERRKDDDDEEEEDVINKLKESIE